MGSNKKKCRRAPGTIVANRAACAKLAEKNKHKYFSWKPDRKQCFSDATCAHPISTKQVWQIFKVKMGPSKQYLSNKKKCRIESSASATQPVRIQSQRSR